MLLGAQNKLHEILQNNGLSSKRKSTPYKKGGGGDILTFTVCI